MFCKVDVNLAQHLKNLKLKKKKFYKWVFMCLLELNFVQLITKTNMVQNEITLDDFFFELF